VRGENIQGMVHLSWISARGTGEATNEVGSAAKSASGREKNSSEEKNQPRKRKRDSKGGRLLLREEKKRTNLGGMGRGRHERWNKAPLTTGATRQFSATKGKGVPNSGFVAVRGGKKSAKERKSGIVAGGRSLDRGG